MVVVPHWIIQKSVFKPANYDLLKRALDELNVTYSSVSIPPGSSRLHPDLSLEGSVYVCGALKLARVAEEKGWKPGSFCNSNDGQVCEQSLIEEWKTNPRRSSLLDLDVVAFPVKEILKEYRLFIVNNEVVTGCRYRIYGQAHASTVVEDDVIDYAYSVIRQWSPAESFVMDIARFDQGLSIIEFNNINSSGFYSCDVKKYVAAIESNYA